MIVYLNKLSERIAVNDEDRAVGWLEC